MTPTGIDDGYGWIEPGETEVGRTTRAVRHFWEKPTPLKAYALLRRGALWNTFVCVARASTIWEMARQATPELYREFMDIRRALPKPHAATVIENIYHLMRPANFSADVCEPLVSKLRVLPAPDVGWSDWGSVERVCATLEQLGKLDERFAHLHCRPGEVSRPLPVVTIH
jgi:mannose-1-phosphate guanylyltransferase